MNTTSSTESSSDSCENCSASFNLFKRKVKLSSFFLNTHLQLFNLSNCRKPAIFVSKRFANSVSIVVMYQTPQTEP